jgi:hypothetical protein
MNDFKVDFASGKVWRNGILTSINTKRDVDLLCGAWEHTPFGRTQEETELAIWLGLRVE